MNGKLRYWGQTVRRGKQACSNSINDCEYILSSRVNAFLVASIRNLKCEQMHSFVASAYILYCARPGLLHANLLNGHTNGERRASSPPRPAHAPPRPSIGGKVSQSLCAIACFDNYAQDNRLVGPESCGARCGPVHRRAPPLRRRRYRSRQDGPTPCRKLRLSRPMPAAPEAVAPGSRHRPRSR